MKFECHESGHDACRFHPRLRQWNFVVVLAASLVFLYQWIANVAQVLSIS